MAAEFQSMEPPPLQNSKMPPMVWVWMFSGITQFYIMLSPRGELPGNQKNFWLKSLPKALKMGLIRLNFAMYRLVYSAVAHCHADIS